MRRLRAALLVAASIFAATPAMAGAQLADKASEASVLIEKARAGGAAVIVELKAPGLDAADADESAETAAADAARQTAVATAVDGFVSRFFGKADGAEASRREIKKMRYAPLVAFVATSAELDRLAGDAAVVRIYPDTRLEPSLTQSVPLIGMPQAWKAGGRGAGTVVAVLDTGVQASHPFFGGRVVMQACFSSNSSDGAGRAISLCPSGKSPQFGGESGRNCAMSLSGCSHGTHVAGIIAGKNPEAGAVPPSGVAPRAGIVAIQVFSQIAGTNNVSTQTSDYIGALEYLYSVRDAIDGGKRLAAINMSFGGSPDIKAPCEDHPARPIVKLLRKAGVASVIATGNEFKIASMGEPACIPEAVKVGSTTKSDLVSDFSNSAYFMDLFAPGSDILSSVPGNEYEYKSGTSMATPTVAGAFAALRSAVPDATVGQILSALIATGKPIRDTRFEGTVTKPRIQVDKALKELKARNNNLVALPRTPFLVPGAVGASRTFTVKLAAKTGTEAWKLASAPDWLVAGRKSGVANKAGDSVRFRARPLDKATPERSGWLVFKNKAGGARLVRVDQQFQKSILMVDYGNANPVLVKVKKGVATPSSITVEVFASNGEVPFLLHGSGWLKASTTSGVATRARQTITIDITPPADLKGPITGGIVFQQTDIDYEAMTVLIELVPVGKSTTDVAAVAAQ